jgi:hypothetical protein
MIRSHLKNVFWPPAFFGGIAASFQILDPPQADLRFKTRPRRDLEPKSYFADMTPDPRNPKL